MVKKIIKEKGKNWVNIIIKLSVWIAIIYN